MADLIPDATRRPADDWRRWLDPGRWRGAILLYALVAAVVCFWRLGATGLVSMEGMVVDGARHMLETGDWIVPRVYDEVYTYKPALAYWLASLPLGLVEDPSELLLRLPFAASGFLMGLAVLLLVGRLAGARAGLLAGVASVSGVLFLQKSRMMEFDGVLAAGVGVAVAAACHNLAAERPRWDVWLLGYVGLAAGFLTKGVPALMAFGPGLLAAAWLAGRLRRLFDWRHLTAAALFVAIAGGYLWAAWAAAGPAAFEQPLVEARARGLGQLSQEDLAALPEARRFTGEEEFQPAGWVEWVGRALAKPFLVLALFLPWTVLPVFAFRRRGGPASPDPLTRSAAGFLAAGTLMFMLTPTQESRYFLPLAAPMGILCGLIADRVLARSARRPRGLATATVALAAILAAATVAMAFRFPSPPVPLAGRVALGIAGVAAGAAILHLARRRHRRREVLLLGIAALCVLLTQYLGVEPYRAGSRDLEPQAKILAPHVPAGATVRVLGPSDEAGKHASLFFYLDRPIRAFRPGDELPAGGVPCLLTARNLETLAAVPGFSFRETARAEHRWFSYRLGTCSTS